MAGAYDDRDGLIWMDGKMINWRDANVHILTHAMHYASSVFEGERAYNGKIFESRKHSERLKASAQMIDFEIPYTIDEIEAAKVLRDELEVAEEAKAGFLSAMKVANSKRENPAGIDAANVSL